MTQQRPRKKAFVILAVWLGIVLIAVRADAGALRLPAIYGDGMVLQRNLPVAIRGWAQPGEAVTVSIAGQSVQGEANGLGRWRLKLAPLAASKEPLELTISSASGEKLVRKDVLVGEVWVGSGQSNMEMGMSGTERGNEFIAATDRPAMRLFMIWRDQSPLPKEDCDADWTPCTPATVRSFSAALYHFGRHIQDDLDVPVGLIQSAYSGTSINPWIPMEGFNLTDAAHLTREADAVRQYQEAYRGKLLGSLEQIERWASETRAAAEAGEPLTLPQLPSGFGMRGTTLFNAHIAPLIPFPIRGVVWYQGEANVARNQDRQYCDAMKALIEGWRRAWSDETPPRAFPFYFVQIAPRQYTGSYANDVTKLPLLWENQVAALEIPNTGMASTMDISPIGKRDPREAHPRNKRDVGYRLALWALAKTYGRENLVYSGPMYASYAIEGSRIRIRFDHVGGGLASRDGEPLTWFQIAGVDRQFVPAEARIEGETVVVSSKDVPAPKAVRFGWHEIAVPNLMNREGLPAVPFRTDAW